jgi:CspA family cold shock protein
VAAAAKSAEVAAPNRRSSIPRVRKRVIGRELFSADARFSKVIQMAEGTIKRLTDKGFGFIETGSGKDLFFHMSACEGVRFEDLQTGQKVSFTEGQGPKGPRAENVKLA